MATKKRNPSRKRHTRHLLRFPEVEGKTLEAVEIDADVQAIMLLFDDNTALSFDLDSGLSVFPELSNRRTGDWRRIKRWPALHTSPSMTKWL